MTERAKRGGSGPILDGFVHVAEEALPLRSELLTSNRVADPRYATKLDLVLGEKSIRFALR